MKYLFTFICGIIITFSTAAQTSVSNISKPRIKKSQEVTNKTTTASSQISAATDSSKPAAESLSLKETEFDFGQIPQGKPVTHVFEFKNTGATPFSLDNVQASCGCTTPVWNKNIVAPGATSEITVGYNAQNEGQFAKPVTITYNGSQVKQITIKGEVWKTPVTSAPENASVNSLKNE
jgi:Protein of unknown function (DUF1573)